MSDLESALLRCTSESRPLYATPFPAVVDGRTVRIATDGKLLLMVDDPGGDADAECDSVVLGLINRYSNPPTLHASRADLIAWAGQDYRAPCQECEEGLTGSQKCQECDGEGVVWCDLDHEHDCPKCKGAKWIGTPCTFCEASGFLHNKKVPIYIPALAISLDAHLIGGLFDLLPGDEIGIAGDLLVAVFYGPGWKLMVAAMRTDATSIRRLHVYSKSEVSA